jgi:hypothetical protein
MHQSLFGAESLPRISLQKIMQQTAQLWIVFARRNSHVVLIGQ